MRKCLHCGGDVDIRNPKGFCDHLEYPQNCMDCMEFREEIYATHGDYSIVKWYDVVDSFVGLSLRHKDGRTWSDTTRAMHHLIIEIKNQKKHNHEQ